MGIANPPLNCVGLQIRHNRYAAVSDLQSDTYKYKDLQSRRHINQQGNENGDCKSHS